MFRLDVGDVGATLSYRSGHLLFQATVTGFALHASVTIGQYTHCFSLEIDEQVIEAGW